ncbi:MAG: hypothetical protein Q8P27_01940, partial [Candidatus Peregrinibacteria bacterium]|nr:hypothetical protein [Candidatus Peregrinibacteria bacterium]
KLMKKLFIQIATTTLILGNLLGFASLALADEAIDLGDSDTGNETFDVGSILSTDDQEQGYFNGEESGTDVPIMAFILDMINFITQIIGVIAMILIIVGGILMIVSEGDENRLQRGKGILEAAIFGLVISMFSYIIVRFVQSLFYIQAPA